MVGGRRALAIVAVLSCAHACVEETRNLGPGSQTCTEWMNAHGMLCSVSATIFTCCNLCKTGIEKVDSLWRQQVRPGPGLVQKVAPGPELVQNVDSRTGLVIIVHGIAYRGCGRGCQTASSSTYEQSRAFKTFQQHVLMPAIASGWNVSLAIDVVLEPQHVQHWHRLTSSLAKSFPIYLNDGPNYRGSSQLASTRTTLNWCMNAMAAAGDSNARGALLLIRVDLMIRKPLPMPMPNDRDERVIVPFRMLGLSSTPNCASKKMSTSDTIIWVPRAARPVAERCLWRQTDAISLDTLCHPDLRFFSPTTNADPNSEVAWNDIYYMIGRNQSTEAWPLFCRPGAGVRL